MENIESNVTEIKEDTKRKFLLYPSKLFRRILAYLGDIFCVFIISVFLMQLFILPIGKAISNYEELSLEQTTASNERFDYLYQNDLLFYEEDLTKYVYSYNYDYTADLYVKYLVFSSDESMKKYNVIEHYWIDFAINKYSDKTSFIAAKLMFSSDSKFYSYFDVIYSEDSLPVNYVLKDKYVNLFRPKFEVNNEISEDGEEALESFKEEFFYGTYLSIWADLNANDQYFYERTAIIENIRNKFYAMYSIVSAISFLLATIIVNLIIPLIDERGRTLTKKILQIEVVRIKCRFQNPTKKQRILFFLLNTIEMLPILFLIPSINLGIAEVFGLSVLFYISLSAIGYVLISLLITITNSLNKSIKELVSFTVVVDSSLMDKYYVEKGYEQ